MYESMNNHQKARSLCLTNGILGIAGGVLIFLATFIFVLAYAIDASYDGRVASVLTYVFYTCLKLAILILGIVSLVYYKEDPRLNVAPHVLFIVGGAISLIPFFGWIGGILAIVGGSLYLAKLKNFDRPPFGQF